MYNIDSQQNKSQDTLQRQISLNPVVCNLINYNLIQTFACVICLSVFTKQQSCQSNKINTVIVRYGIHANAQSANDADMEITTIIQLILRKKCCKTYVVT